MSNRILIKKSKVTLSQPPLVIGRGAMGEVYLATFQGKSVVVKRSQEYSNYFKLQNHSNILKFFGVIREDRYSFSLVLEYAPNGNLSSYLKSHTIAWSDKARICRDIALGLMHCHENNVLHFDLKPENVLLDRDCVPKLADFGISKTKSQMVLDHGKAGGTINYVAPERVCRELKMREFFDNHPKLSDIYSFGLILWSGKQSFISRINPSYVTHRLNLTLKMNDVVAKEGVHPYEGMDDDEIKEYKRSTRAMYDLLEQLPSDTPQIYNQLIFDLTQYVPSERHNLPVDDLDSSDDDFDGSVSSSKPVSTSTTIESEKSTLASDKDITFSETSTEPRPLSISSSIYRNPIRSGSAPVPSSSSSDNDDNNTYNLILGKPIVTSPASNEDDNPMGIVIPPMDAILNRDIRRDSKGSYNRRDSDCSRYRRDSGVDRKSQCTLVGSPLTPKTPPFEKVILKISNVDQELMDGVISICDHWENVTDDVLKRKLDNLCYDKKKKPKDILALFENYPSKSADYYFAVGFMNEHGFGKVKDPTLAFEYYSKAADLGDPRGLVFVGTNIVWSLEI
ncbi:4444_t:CDS:2 [Funneliformis caledonium]|uniref:4444_t:CDS:1 n=1 Tax=Funneliformis caledonium TaxID=1117310 RepID=A0A9N9FJU5_9GLOM|nr:4444_t:CDS:2 [Funneliformis caledonium]